MKFLIISKLPQKFLQIHCMAVRNGGRFGQKSQKYPEGIADTQEEEESMYMAY